MLSKALQGAAKGVAVDSDFENVTLLLHGNGTNGAQNNTFIDGSSNAFSITRNGNTTQGTFSPYGSNWSNYFDGSGDALTTNTTNSGWQLGTGDFEIAFWIYPESVTGNRDIFTQRNASGTPQIFLVNNVLRYNNALIAGILDATVNIVTNKWQYCVLSRVSGTTRWFIDGVAAGSVADTNNWSSTNSWWVSSTAQSFQGYISNIRLVKGSGVTSSTVPTAPLTAISGTTFLSCQSNRFVDNSTNAFAITVNGNTSVQRFSPFSPTAAYASGTIGGSGYFDGTGDYLQIANNAVLTPTGDFTIEFWAYVTDSSGTQEWYSKGYGIQIYISTTVWGSAFSSGNNSSYYVNYATTPVITNAWTHVAATRSGNTYRLFINGVETNSATSSSAPNTGTDVLRLGEWSLGTTFGAKGYMAAVRYLNGTALYTSNFTLPTAPPTAVTNTQLLCNFTNAGIIDNAMMNDLETVGNAQISTTQSKFGGSSMYFDETGDYLTAPSTQNVAFGTGNFTIECWVRFATSTVGNGQGVFQLSNGYLNSAVRGPAVGTDDTSGKWAIYYGTSSSVHATSIPSTNTWYHVAFVRNSSTSKLYIDGTELISVSDSTNYTDTNFTIGGWYSSSYLLNGYIDDLRITKGVARYTANFTAPTAPFADQ